MIKPEEREERDNLAKQWQAGGLTRRDEREILEIMVDRYKDFIMSKVKTETKAIKQDVFAMYREEVYNALNTWQAKSSFDTYLMWKIKFVPAKYFREVQKSVIRNTECFTVDPDIIDGDMSNFFQDQDRTAG